jgi:hypothetical protein
MVGAHKAFTKERRETNSHKAFTKERRETNSPQQLQQRSGP